jgi:multicomponent Na+:H+ antiporter subunit D
MTEIIASLPPGSILILGGLLVPLLRGRLLQVWMLALPVVSFLHLLSFPEGYLLHVHLFDYELTPIRIDRLSLVWGYIYHLVAFLTIVYSLHVKDGVQNVSGTTYVGAAVAAVFAGDLITLFVFWELTAVTSVFLIWASRNERSYRAGMRYLIIQVGSGVLLLAGTIIHLQQSGSIAFGHLGIGTLGTNLIFLAFGIKCAFPLLHNWLQDSYPEATVTGTVFLSAFTTKLAVYALARGFPGTELLIWIGATMTVFPIFYAVIENDLRRVLSYRWWGSASAPSCR